MAAHCPALLSGTLLRGAGAACGTARADTSLSKRSSQHSRVFTQICTYWSSCWEKVPVPREIFHELELGLTCRWVLMSGTAAPGTGVGGQGALLGQEQLQMGNEKHRGA